MNTIVNVDDAIACFDDGMMRFSLQKMAGEDCIIVMPDEVHSRYEWPLSFEKMGLRVFSESSFVQMLSGCLPLDGVTPRELTFLRSKKR